MSTGRVFRRSSLADPPVAVEAHGCTIRDAAGREYLDAAGGAIVVNVGHGRHEIAAAMADQAESLGGVESLIEVPAAMTHLSVAGSPLEVDPALVRLSVGIEGIADLLADLTRALDEA